MGTKRPRRMNLVDITIEQISVADTEYDEDYQMPVGGKEARPTTIQVKGQVNFGDGGHQFEARQPSMTGDRIPSTSHIVFRTCDLEEAGITIKKDDRVISIAGEDVDLLVDEVRGESPLDGGYLLRYVELVSNKEERASK